MFFITVYSDVLTFYMVSFFHVFIFSDVFGCFHCWLHLFTSLFVRCLSGTSFLCCCTVKDTDFRERSLLSGIFNITFLPAFIKASLWPAFHPWRLQVLPLWLETETQPICYQGLPQIIILTTPASFELTIIKTISYYRHLLSTRTLNLLVICVL